MRDTVVIKLFMLVHLRITRNVCYGIPLGWEAISASSNLQRVVWKCGLLDHRLRVWESLYGVHVFTKLEQGRFLETVRRLASQEIILIV
jgi:hypothetical protein